MTNIRRYHIPNTPAFMTVVCRNRERYLAGDRAKELLLSVMREVKDRLPFSMLGYVVLDDHFHWMIRLGGGLSDRISGSATGHVSGSAGHTLTYKVDGAYKDGAGDLLRRMSGSASHTLTYIGYGEMMACRSGCDQRELPDEAWCEERGGGSLQGHTISHVMQSLKLCFAHRYKKDFGISTSLAVWQRRFWDHMIRDQEDFNRHLDYIHYNPVKHGYVSNPGDFQWSSLKTYVERGQYQKGWGTRGEPESLLGAVWE